MAERLCPGLPADWLNGWLAAVGATVLVPGMRLRWSDDPVPLALLSTPDQPDVAEAIHQALPTAVDISRWPIARHIPGRLALDLKVSVEAWSDRAVLARQHATGWTLTSLYTDLAWSQREHTHVVERGQFVTPMPGRDNTVYDRLRKLAPTAGAADAGRTLDGVAGRIQNYGLGFDERRIGSLADESDQLVDPLVEMLAFHGLALLPTRGDGSRLVRQRGWRGGRSSSGAFRWPAWSPSLDSGGIDALLDVPARSAELEGLVGITGWWEVVPYESRGSSDQTRGYGSRRLAVT